MNGHLTGKEIDNYVSGFASGSDSEKVRKHISSCPQCRDIVEALSSVVREERIDSRPGVHIRESVMLQWQRINNEVAGAGTPVKPGIRKSAAWLAAAASVVLAVSVYIITGVIKPAETYQLTLKPVAGEVYINDAPAAVDTGITAQSAVKTGINGIALISTGGYNLYIGNSTSVTVADNSIKSGIHFILNEGEVISKSSEGIKYSFTCGDYSAVPTGTEFIIRYISSRLTVAVLKGGVSVTGPDTHIQVEAWRVWSSENGNELSPLDPAAASMIISGSFGSKKPARPQDNAREGSAGKEARSAERGSSSGSTSPPDGKKEMLERESLRRELRQDIIEMRREQRKERKEMNRE